MPNKILAAVLLCLILASSAGVLFLPKKSQAVVMTYDQANFTSWLKHLGVQALEWAKTLKDNALRIAIAKFRKVLLDYMANEIIAWIQGEGTPKFVTDWKGFLQDAANIAGSQALQELVGDETMQALCSPNWAIRLNILLSKPEPFKQKVMCTLEQIGASLESFTDNFHNGGWSAWITISESQNNLYGLYLDTYFEKLAREAQAKEAASAEASSGSGFLNDSVCREMSCLGDSVPVPAAGGLSRNEIPAECSCTKWETRTPGKILADTLNLSVTKDLEWLITNEEWESYVVAITDALVNRLVKEGVMALTNTDVGGGVDGYAPPNPVGGEGEEEGPTSQLAIVDEYHVEITSETAVSIFYSLDGTTPSLASIPYTGPITIDRAVTLKWFSMDINGNQEPVRSETLVPPLRPDQLQNPSTPPAIVAVPVGSNAIAIVTSSKGDIFCTTDGTTPTLSSENYYIKIFENLSPSVSFIQCISVSPDGTTQSQIFQSPENPPFPQSEIQDLVQPIAIFNSSLVAGWTRLNPSDSVDPDGDDKIIMYEWDLDNNGVYDWYILDHDRDGAFDEWGCRTGGDVCEGSSSLGYGYGSSVPGLGDMRIPSNTAAGTIEVWYTSSGQRNITLRVTDDEGLYHIITQSVSVSSQTTGF